MRSTILLVTLLAFAATAPAAPPPPRPNILFIYTDDQRHDALGVVQAEQGDKGRFPWLKTPNLDRLASSGLRFHNAFAVNAVCSPSRAVFLTGLYSHANGVRDNFTPLPEGQRTLGSRFQALGYATAYFGKWHMGKQETRPGFDTWASQIGHGWFNDCDLNVNSQTVKTKGWLDDVVTDHVIDYLRAPREKPFFAVVGYKAPHSPYDRRNDGADTRAYETAEARAVPNLGDRPTVIRDSGFDATPFNAAKITPEYFRLLDSVDRNIGRLLDALEAAGLDKNTIILFTSDNGYFLGERGLGDKRFAYEESMRVPLLVRWPGVTRPGTTTGSMATYVDFAPTLLDAAGAPAPAELHGVSFTKVLRDPSAKARDQFFYEYFREEKAPKHPTVFAVRTADKKLIHYPENPAWDELFDLSQDPYEINNLIGQATHKTLRTELWGMLKAEASRCELPPDALKPSNAP